MAPKKNPTPPAHAAQLPLTLPENVKTAYDLLAYVRKLILDEPRRYDQGLYVVSERIGTLATQVQAEHSNGNARYQPPACGTVGCVAGWCSLMGVGAELPNQADGVATRLLGFSEFSSAVSSLFDGGALLKSLRPGEPMPKLGTRAYARLGARHIQRFLDANETHLRSVQLSDSIASAKDYLRERYPYTMNDPWGRHEIERVLNLV